VPQSYSTVALAHGAVRQSGVAAHVAAAHHAAASSTGAQSVSASSLLVQMVVGLVVIIVLIKLASKFVQGRSGRTLGRGPRPHGVSVVGRQSLGKGVAVAMVSAGTQTFLLGVTTRQVTLLGEIDTAGAESADTGELVDGDGGAGPLQLLRGGNRPSLSAGGVVPGWKSAIEQMRVRTARRA
jgi:flagellar biogenesis protein FliO